MAGRICRRERPATDGTCPVLHSEHSRYYLKDLESHVGRWADE